jgi:SOS-response transcriptional repressor LexA
VDDLALISRLTKEMNGMQRISERQGEFLDFMKDYERRHGRPPTFREIAMALEISSKGSVSAMVNSLAKLGFVDKANGVNRGTHVRV